MISDGILKRLQRLSGASALELFWPRRSGKQSGYRPPLGLWLHRRIANK